MGLFDRILKKKETEIAAPAAGRCFSIKRVPDPTFGEEIMGKGVAIEPTDGRFYAPVDGVVSTVFPTLHAIGITTAEGVEVLLHVGLDTVKLDGKHFKVHVELDTPVKKGDLILEADLRAIREEGYNIITPVLICNTPDFKEVIPVQERDVVPGDEILRVAL